MNEKNFDYLKDQLKYTGFGETLEKELKEKLQMQMPAFQIHHKATFGQDTASATLHFKKSAQSDLYFFNKYDLDLKQGANPSGLKQSFYINKENSLTLKEAYNLMSGRAVNKNLTNKEGHVYNAWIQMDLKQTDKKGNFLIKQFHSNYGFDMEKELAKHPIKELTQEQDKAMLIASLQKGNRQAVTFLQEGMERRMFIEANPRFKSINMYDSSLQRVHSQSHKEKQTPRQSVKQAEMQKRQGPDTNNNKVKTVQKKSKGKSQSFS